jgi:NTE family protein
VSAGEVGTTDFNLSEEQRHWLLHSGHRAAAGFLRAWRPEAYVNRAGRPLAGWGRS